MTTNMWEKHVWMKLGSVKDTGDTGTYFQRINAGRKDKNRILACMIKTTITPAGLRDAFEIKWTTECMLPRVLPTPHINQRVKTEYMRNKKEDGKKMQAQVIRVTRCVQLGGFYNIAVSLRELRVVPYLTGQNNIVHRLHIYNCGFSSV